jgi:hypothetical protein
MPSGTEHQPPMSAARPSRTHASPPTAVSLRRWLCAWLALLTLAQLIGSTLTSLQGARHHHRPSVQAATPSLAVIRWRHGEVLQADAHAQMHARGEAHDHVVTDPSVLPVGADAATEAVAQLGTSLAPGAEMRWSPHDSAHHVQTGAARWVPTTRALAPPLKPPRG